DGWLYGVVSVALLGSRFLFIDIGSKAIGDPPLLFFLTSYLFSSLLLAKAIKNKQNKKQSSLLALSAILVGLAIAVKLNAVISLLHLVIVYLFLRKINGYSIHETSARIIYLLAISFGLFAVLNPLIWDNPIRRSVEMALYRTSLFKKQQTLFAIDALPNLFSRLRAVFIERFPDLLILMSAGVGYLLFAKVGEKKIVKQFKIKKIMQLIKSEELCQKKFVFGSWLLLNLVITTLIIPLDWDRYYLPILLAVIYLEAAVVKKTIVRIYSLFKEFRARFFQ
ncbi:MAG: hypothetical protein U9O78_02655, partial [Patescibacteria group bacterium]|nr:hypothetical protein [Patescibacteria group bacterium]